MSTTDTEPCCEHAKCPGGALCCCQACDECTTTGSCARHTTWRHRTDDTERDERLRGIQERATAATEGPWATAQGKHPRLFGINGPDDYVTLHDGTLQEADAAFIAAARTDVPWLLAEVARLDAVVTAVREQHQLTWLPNGISGDSDLVCGCGWVAEDENDTCPTVRALDGGAA